MWDTAPTHLPSFAQAPNRVVRPVGHVTPDHLQALSNSSRKNKMANETISESRSCPLCGKRNANIIARMSARQIIESSAYYGNDSYQKLGVNGENKYGISRCSDCSFVFSSETPSEVFLDKLYSGGEKIDESVRIFARPERAAYAFGAMSRLLNAISTRCVPDEKGVPAEAIRILDVGCAFGVASLGLTRNHYPYEVFGIEWSQSTRDYLSEQGMRAFRTLNEIPPSTIFDGILLNDVLEHLPDPVTFVKQLRGFTHPDTVIWVNVPNFIDWRSKEIIHMINSESIEIPKDMNPWEHLSYFSPRTLDTLMGIAEFQRMAEYPTYYPVQCSSFSELVKQLVKAVRDILRIYKGKYPSEVSTAGLYSLK